MATTTTINGQPVSLPASPEVDWPGWLNAVDAYLAERAWLAHQILGDGQPVSREEPPEIAPEMVFEVVAGPADVNPVQFVQQLAAILPQFRNAVVAHSDLFSRGDWKSGLETLTPLLDELGVAAEGLQLGFKALQQEELRGVQQFSELLEELSTNIHEQSWVEVSDLLLYELDPLLEEWEGAAAAVQA